jgi:hypothetical protein
MVNARNIGVSNHQVSAYAAEPGALRCEPLKAASGAFVAHANFPFGCCAYERLCPTFASLSGNSCDFHLLNAFVSQSNIQKQKTGAYSLLLRGGLSPQNPPVKGYAF